MSRDVILELLKKVLYPGLNRDIVSFGMVKEIEVSDTGTTVYIDLPSKDPAMPARVDAAVRAALESQVQGRLEVLIRPGGGNAPGEAARPQSGNVDPNTLPKLLGQVRHVIAVASGKGGVGKSAIASNLAVTLARSGYRTGLLDADIYGPSMQLVMGGERPMVQGNKIIPVEGHGVAMISLGHLVDEEAAMIWRGPMVMQALVQLMQDVAWPELDFMVVDMPPGTGDVQLTMAQRVKLSGAVVVTTPQEVALIDARKAITMFRKVDVPILGLIENMSWFQCPGGSERHYIFGQGGGAREAARQGVELLAELPIEPRICQGGDSGQPIVTVDEEYARLFDRAVAAICRKLPPA
jgi:ATP-binding protein involved in chromosome partitioning